MEVDVDDDEFYSDEKWPTHEPLGPRYLVVKKFRCKAQQEWELEEWFKYYPVEVDGIIYERGEWLDPGWRAIKAQLPPRLQYPGWYPSSGWGGPVKSSPPKTLDWSPC